MVFVAHLGIAHIQLLEAERTALCSDLRDPEDRPAAGLPIEIGRPEAASFIQIG